MSLNNNDQTSARSLLFLSFVLLGRPVKALAVASFEYYGSTRNEPKNAIVNATTSRKNAIVDAGIEEFNCNIYVKMSVKHDNFVAFGK